MVVKKEMSNLVSTNGPPWFDKQCMNYKSKYLHDVHLLRKNKQTDNYPEHRRAFLDAKSSYNNLLVAKRKKFLFQLENKISNVRNSTEFYRALAYFRTRRLDTNYIETVTVDRFRTHYEKLFNVNTCVNIPTVCIRTIHDNSRLDRDFTIDDMNKCMKNLSTKKAPGPDGIPNEVWKSLNTEQKVILLECFNKCWNERRLPDEWSLITISPIFKKGDKSNPDNYRPISLVNTGLKLYTSMLSDRLSEWCDSNKKMSCSQAAYRKGYGCEDHIFVLNSILQLNCSRRRKVYALFIDLSKAFDLVNHKLL
jgi:hypothetical protein